MDSMGAWFPPRPLPPITGSGAVSDVCRDDECGVHGRVPADPVSIRPVGARDVGDE